MDEEMCHVEIRKIWEKNLFQKKVMFSKEEDVKDQLKEEEDIEKGEIEAARYNTGLIKKMDEEMSNIEIKDSQLRKRLKI